MDCKNKYVSMFKINGRPILPPLMTNKKRKEMQNYKHLAMAIETKLDVLKCTKSNCLTSNFDDTDQRSDTTMISDNEYLKISNILNQCNLDSTTKKNKENLLKKLNRSDIFIVDIASNTLTIPNCEGEKCNFASPQIVPEKIEDNLEKTQKNTIEIKEMHENTNKTVWKKSSKSENCYKKRPLDLQIKITEDQSESKDSQTSIKLVNPEEDILKKISANNCNELNTSNDQENYSSLKSSPNTNKLEETKQEMIRSDSFILESPSDALIEHIVKCKHEEFSKYVTNPPSGNIAKKNNSNIQKKQTNKMLETVEHKSRSTILIAKGKKHPYDVKQAIRCKSFRKHKSPAKKTLSLCSLKQKKISKSLENVNYKIMEKDFLNMKDLIEEIEKNHRLQLQELLLKQQEEQQIMEKNFKMQQKLLFEKFSAAVNKNKVESEIKPVLSENVISHSPSLKNSPKFISNSSNPKKSPLCSINNKNNNHDSQEVSNLSVVNNRGSALHSSTSKDSSRKRLFSGANESTIRIYSTSNSTRRREEAVTKINAYVRGYLVRRLFKTDYIQRIIQTIHDTLLFVLDLHLETGTDDSDANIKLKARLLQQLTSACYSLHKIFFEISIKERMEIIAKDRLLLQKKSFKNQRSIHSPQKNS